MVRYVKTFLITVFVFCQASYAEDAFERNCVACHKQLPATLQEMFKRYLLVYSSEANVKAGIKHYLKYPRKELSAMSDLFVETAGIKEKTSLNRKELDEAIDIYWDKYKVFGKLK
jgi:hypothetical protein